MAGKKWGECAPVPTQLVMFHFAETPSLRSLWGRQVLVAREICFCCTVHELPHVIDLFRTLRFSKEQFPLAWC